MLNYFDYKLTTFINLSEKNYIKLQKNIKSSFMIASNISECDTPRCIFLKRGIKQLSDEIVIKNKKLKELQRTLNRQKKEIGTLKTFILQLKKQRFLNDDASNILLDSSGKHKNLVINWSKNILDKRFLNSIAL